MTSNPNMNDLEQTVRKIIAEKNGVLPKEIVKKVANITRQLEDSNLFLSYGERRGLWKYYEDEGIWKNDADSMVRRYVGNVLHKEDEYRSRIANEVVHALRDLYYQPDVKLGGPPHIIVVPNGRVDLETGQFHEDFASDEYHIVKLPVTYDPKAECPRISQFFNEVLSSEDDVQAMVELFGYCLYKGWPYDVLVMLVGVGANGKSVLLKLLEMFLGPENVTAMTLHSLATDQFASSHLFGKLANVAGEVPQRPLRYTNYLKDLTGGGTVYANIKFEKGMTFENTAKMIFSSNTPPAILDDSYGWWRRLRRFDFPYIFSRDDPKTIPRDRLLKQLGSADELSGLLNLAITGWQRFREQGCLTGSKDPDVERIEYLRISDATRYLAETFMEQDSYGNPIVKKSLYEVYLRWCALDKRSPKSPQTFHKILRKSATYIAEREKRYPTDDRGFRKHVRVYSNVRLKVQELERAGVDLDDIDLFFEPVDPTTGQLDL